MNLFAAGGVVRRHRRDLPVGLGLRGAGHRQGRPDRGLRSRSCSSRSCSGCRWTTRSSWSAACTRSGCTPTTTARAITVGQAETGGIITAAAIIMIAVFGGFVLGDNRVGQAVRHRPGERDLPRRVRPADGARAVADAPARPVRTGTSPPGLTGSRRGCRSSRRTTSWRSSRSRVTVMRGWPRCRAGPQARSGDGSRRSGDGQFGVVGDRPLDHCQGHRPELVVLHGRAQKAN